jgi:hypothetical protein
MSTLVFPSLVRDQVLEQHAALREMLRSAIEHVARWRLATRDRDVTRLRAFGRELCDRFREHLAFEDEHLRPVLAVLDTWGPERVRELHREHTRQREALDAFAASFETDADAEQTALALTALAEDIERDMAAEEDGCLGASAMSAGVLLEF